MHQVFLSALLVTALAATAAPKRALAEDNSPGAAAASGAPASSNAPAQPNAGQGETWRYRRHDGLWWYWLPSNQWVYWTDNHWVAYDPQQYARFLAARAPRAYSYSGGYSSGYAGQGNWGPIRYNQYGQPQYPYSQRSSGIRQLGPVPAAGGVRSLPGWGGER